MYSKLGLATALAVAIDASPIKRSEIQWSSCDLSGTDLLNRTFQVLCGSLPVPLDYTDPNSTKTIDLPLLKIPAASNGTKKETILTNFGGPGINGTQDMITNGGLVHDVIGTDHDLITWLPRGTQGPLLFSCYPSDAARAAAAVTYPSPLGNASNVADGQLWSNAKALADSCAQIANQTGPFIGTAFGARDMISIVDALNEDGLVRYWGFSYGTALGATTAAMFPDRIGAVVLDGVVNVREYYHNYQLSSTEASDGTLLGFATGCLQNPNICPLAANHTSPTSLQNSIFALIDESQAVPIVLPNPASAGGDIIIDYTTLKGTIYNFMYTPEEWPLLAELLSAIIARNASTILSNADSVLTPPAGVDDEAQYGIACGDKFPRTDSFASIVPYLASIHTARIGSDQNDQLSMQCAQWPFEAKERYAGNFEVKTRNPLLVVGNTWDPVTPFVSARNVSAGFEGSVLLEQMGYGHTSPRQASLCTQSAVRAYFNEGKLPAVGTVCEVTEPLFPTDGGAAAWAYVIRELENGSDDGNGTTAVRK